MPYYRFTGKELDPETGLYYYGARYYDPVLSRWISADPILGAYLEGKPNGGIYAAIHLGLYTYTYNNPIKYTDPDGEFAFVPLLIMAAGAYLVQAFLAPEIANAPAPGEEILEGPSALEQGGAMLSGALIARTAVQQGGKAALKEIVEEVTDVPTDIGDIGKLGKNFDEGLIKVRHYTNIEGKKAISESGTLRMGTYVTKPDEIPSRAGHKQIEKMLEIEPGKGIHYIDVKVPSSSLKVPPGGPATSGGKWQRQLREPAPIDPTAWKRPPGRPTTQE